MSTAPLITRPAPRRTASAPRPQRGPNLRLVGPPRHSRRYVLLTAAVVAIGVFGTVSLNALAAEQSFAVRNLERDLRELSFQYEELTAEVAQLEAPERIRSVAMGQLGMVPASQPGYLIAGRHVPGDDEIGGVADMVRSETPQQQEVADPVKPVLGAGG